MKTHQILLEKRGKYTIPRYIGNLFPFNLTHYNLTFHIITTPFHWVHSWMFSTFTTFASEGAGNVWNTCCSGCLIRYQRMQRAVHTHTRETGSRGLGRKAHLSGKVICAQSHTVHSEELRFGEFRKAGIRSVTPYLLLCYLRSELQTWLKLYIGLYKCSDESVRFRLNHSGTVCPLGTFSKRISHQRQKCRYQWRATFNATSWLHSYNFWI